MRVTDFDFDLPEELIAQSPPEIRGSSRMLVLDRATGAIEDNFFRNLSEILRSGDLLSFIDPKRPLAGLRFDGRMNEVFKLDSGTKVSAGKLRLDALDMLRPLAQEVVVAGADRKDLRLLIFPDWEVCAAAAGLNGAAKPAQIAANPTIRAMFRERLAQLYAAGTGSSNRIVAGLLVENPASSASGELTEKGTVNGRALQRNRPELLDALFGDRDECVLRVDRP